MAFGNMNDTMKGLDNYLGGYGADEDEYAAMQGGESPIALLQKFFGQGATQPAGAATPAIDNISPGAPSDGQAGAASAPVAEGPLMNRDYSPAGDVKVGTAPDSPPAPVAVEIGEDTDGVEDQRSLWDNFWPSAVGVGAGAAAGYGISELGRNREPKVPVIEGEQVDQHPFQDKSVRAPRQGQVIDAAMPNAGALPPPGAALPPPGVPVPSGQGQIPGAAPSQPQLQNHANPPEAIQLPNETPGESIRMPSGEEFFLDMEGKTPVIRNVNGEQITDPNTLRAIQQQLRKGGRGARQSGNAILQLLRGIK